MSRASRAFVVTVATAAGFVVLAIMVLFAPHARAGTISGSGVITLSSESGPAQSTDQILGVLRGVAGEAGIAYSRAAAGTSTVAVPRRVPTGGVQTGLGGGVRRAPWFHSPPAVGAAVLAGMFVLAGLGLERLGLEHRRRR